jgi:DNA-binding transcriptional MocR family regulator
MTSVRLGQQVSETLAEAIRSGLLPPGDELPSITELSALQAIGTCVIRHAMTALAATADSSDQQQRITLARSVPTWHMSGLKSRRSFDSAVPRRTWPTHYGPVSPNRRQ